MFPCNDLFLTLRLWACSSELRLYSEAACQDGRLSRGCLSTTPPRDQRLLLFHVGSSLWPTAHYSFRRVFFLFRLLFNLFFSLLSLFFLFFLSFAKIVRFTLLWRFFSLDGRKSSGGCRHGPSCCRAMPPWCAMMPPWFVLLPH